MPTSDVAINLIGEEEMAHTPVGRIVSWAVTYGRYIMISAEVVVLLAFISRFSLDRKLTDLNDDVSQKQAIIEANVDFEQEFRTTQDQVNKIHTVLATPNATLDILDALQKAIPTDAHLESLTISPTKVTGTAVVRSPESLSFLISSLQAATSPITNIDIGDVTRSVSKGIQFQFSAVPRTQKK